MSAAAKAALLPVYDVALGGLRVGLALFSIEFRRSLCLWLFPLLVGVLAWIVYDGLPAGIWLWTETVWSLQYSLILFGPLVGGLAVWTAGREGRREMGDLLLTTSRPAVARDLAVWAATAAWCCLAYALVAVTFLSLTGLLATWGSPEIGSVLIGLLAVVAHSAVGYAVGSYLPSRFVAPLFAVSVYWIQGITLFGLGSRFRNLSPLGSDIASTVFYDETPDVFVLQALWLTGLAALALTAVALKRERNARYWTALAVAATVAAAGATALALVPTETVEARGTPVTYEPVCDDGGIEVCVHPAYETALPATSRVVNDLVEPLVGLPGAPTRAEQRPSEARLRPDGTLVYSLYGGFYRSNVNIGYGFREYMEQEIVPALAVGPSGYVEGKPYGSDFCRTAADAPGEAQRAVSGWLIYRAGDYGSADSMAFREAVNGQLCPGSAPLVERFDALAPAERRAWLEANYADLRDGEITPRDLP